MRGNWVTDFEAGFPSCRQQVLKSSTATHPFFNHELTAGRRDVAFFYVCSQMLVFKASTPLGNMELVTEDVAMQCIAQNNNK